MMVKYVILVGVPGSVDRIVGPFDSSVKAYSWASHTYKDTKTLYQIRELTIPVEKRGTACEL